MYIITGKRYLYPIKKDLNPRPNKKRKIEQEIPIIGDGNCFFRAISYSLYKTQEKHIFLRKLLYNEFKKNIYNDLPISKQQVENIQYPGYWINDELFIHVMQIILKRDIIIDIHKYHGKWGRKRMFFEKEPIYLKYYNNVHYNALCIYSA